MGCLFSERGHTWRPVAGTYVVGHDHAIRCCSLCGASGRIDNQGRVRLVWEPKMCGETTRMVETPGNVSIYSCHLPEDHEGDHDETYPARVRR